MAAGLDTFVKGNATVGVGNQKLAPTVEADGTKVFTLEASIIDWEVSPGKTVKAWAYNGMVPGPWIRTEPNDKVKVVLHNSLPLSTDIHFHGISTPFGEDGVSPLTQPSIAPGETYTYSWTNPDHPELGMYHAHFNGQVAVLNGMFAVFQSGDVAMPKAQSIDWETIPGDLKVTQELPMVLNDAGTIGLTINGKGYPATAPVVANPGDVIEVHYYNEGLQAHPMHLHHVEQLVIAKDGWPLAQPYYADTILIAPGERYTVLITPTTNDIGVWAWHCHILSHAENDTGLYGMVTALIVNDPNKK
jgi:FtsP/CotA-like multicopper oxidase with cupredoxin domain